MGNRIRLSKIHRQEDYAYFSQLVFNELVMKMNMGRVFTEEEAKEFFSFLLEYNTTNEQGGAHLVYTPDGVFLGIGNLWIRDGTGEIEYMILPQFWGKGYATEVAGTLVGLARTDPCVKIIRGLTDPENIASVRVLQKNGFQFDKTEKVEEDGSVVAIYSLVQQENFG